MAKKSWFCFDDEIVCLGAGITSTMNSPVRTTVEHKRIVTDELGIYVCGEGKLPTESYEKRYTGAKWMLMDGHAGYVFPSGGEVYINRYTCDTANNQSFLEIGINHGANPVDATYEYVLIPYADAEKLDTYTKNPDITVISNTKSLQAVREEKIGVSCYVFHEPGECEGISVDTPCIVALTKKGSEFTLAVTDPTHKRDRIALTLDKRIALISASDKLVVDIKEEKTNIVANVFMAHGRKFEMKYEDA